MGEIIDEVLGYAANIQNINPGWSNTNDIKLKLEHQYFLDPYRDNDAFQMARKASDWHAVICKDFAQWLNRLLIGKEKQFTPQREHRRLWMAFMDQPLRDYNQTIESDIKNQTREIV
jgi:CRISPR-associated protein Csy1